METRPFTEGAHPRPSLTTASVGGETMPATVSKRSSTGTSSAEVIVDPSNDTAVQRRREAPSAATARLGSYGQAEQAGTQVKPPSRQAAPLMVGALPSLCSAP